MSRYIDKDKLIENLNYFAPENYNSLINDLITKQPEADVVEVVRCKDCKYWRKDCRLDPALLPSQEYEYCSYGEREEDEE